MAQPIPTRQLMTRAEHIGLHQVTRRGGRNKDWKDEHNSFVQKWESRHHRVVTGEFTDSTIASQAYMRWYKDHTVEYITNPAYQASNPRGFQNDGQRMTMLMDGMSQFYQRSGDEMGTNMATRYMDFAHADHGGYLPTHVVENPVYYQLPPVPHRARRRGRGRGRVGRMDVEDNVGQENMEASSTTNYSSSQILSPPPFDQFSQMGTQNYDEVGPSTNCASPQTNFINLFQHSESLPYFPQFQDTSAFDLNNAANEFIDEDYDGPDPSQPTQP
ncbi:hypothetical protein QVD17_13753 [Tagetes erecta]|uniref:Aminotransferase-like plant mobile domain-containing protein n=1 Tax=Tagetes erecta TaxID=13708 RepID=A0AAD8KY60_TARER|nr:hypothetical protein QVD17_13753 [Tagetes erecta]